MTWADLHPVDFAVMAIREDEYTAVLERFPVQELCLGKNRTYTLTRLQFQDGATYLVSCAPSIEQGGGHAQDAARDMIEDLDPGMLLLVGIAGAVPEREFTLGDVIIAKRLHDFSVGAALVDRDLQVTNQGGPMHKLVQDLLGQLPALKTLLGDWNSRHKIGRDRPTVNPTTARIHGDEAWIEKVRTTLDAHFGKKSSPRAPLVTARSIASGNLLVKDPAKLKDWIEHARELAAVEMGLNGVYIAARRMEREYPVLAIRGISDIVGLERDAAWTQYACDAAASCAHAFVAAQLVTPRTSPGGETNAADEVAVDAEAFDAYFGVLRDRRVGVKDNWGGEITSGMGSQIERITLPVERMSGSGVLVVQLVPEGAALNPPRWLDVGVLQGRDDILVEVERWTDHYEQFSGYHYNPHPKKMRRRNAEGLLLCSGGGNHDGWANWYVQFCNDGTVEAVDTRLMHQVLHSRVIPGTALELAVRTLVSGVLRAMHVIGVGGQVLVATTIIGFLERVSISYDSAVPKGPHRIGKKHRLLLPPVEYSIPFPELAVDGRLRPVFDALAHAGGWPASLNFGESGEWRAQNR